MAKRRLEPWAGLVALVCCLATSYLVLWNEDAAPSPRGGDRKALMRNLHRQLDDTLIEDQPASSGPDAPCLFCDVHDWLNEAFLKAMRQFGAAGAGLPRLWTRRWSPPPPLLAAAGRTMTTQGPGYPNITS